MESGISGGWVRGSVAIWQSLVPMSPYLQHTHTQNLLLVSMRGIVFTSIEKERTVISDFKFWMKLHKSTTFGYHSMEKLRHTHTQIHTACPITFKENSVPPAKTEK